MTAHDGRRAVRSSSGPSFTGFKEAHVALIGAAVATAIMLMRRAAAALCVVTRPSVHDINDAAASLMGPGPPCFRRSGALPAGGSVLRCAARHVTLWFTLAGRLLGRCLRDLRSLIWDGLRCSYLCHAASTYLLGASAALRLPPWGPTLPLDVPNSR